MVLRDEYIDWAEQFLAGRGFNIDTLAHPANGEMQMMAAMALNLATNLDIGQCDYVVATICRRHPWTA